MPHYIIDGKYKVYVEEDDAVAATDVFAELFFDQKYVTVKNLDTGDVWTVDMHPNRCIFICCQSPEDDEPHAMPGGIGI